MRTVCQTIVLTVPKAVIHCQVPPLHASHACCSDAKAGRGSSWGRTPESASMHKFECWVCLGGLDGLTGRGVPAGKARAGAPAGAPVFSGDDAGRRRGRVPAGGGVRVGGQARAAQEGACPSRPPPTLPLNPNPKHWATVRNGRHLRDHVCWHSMPVQQRFQVLRRGAAIPTSEFRAVYHCMVSWV